MGIEVDLLENYPKPHRDTSKRANEKNDEISVTTTKAKGTKCPVCWKISIEPCIRHST